MSLALAALGRVPRTVLDPSCGAGSMLLAAADALVALGVDAAEVPVRLVGVDVDSRALSATRSALDAWAEVHGVDAGAATLLNADALGGPAGVPDAELLVGNPPFSSPLNSDASRVPESPIAGLGPYTDTSARHLLAAVQSVPDGAVVCLVQPQSLLGARDAAKVRSAVMRDAELVGMWLTDEQPFDAAVQVCAPILRRRTGAAPGHAGPRSAGVDLYWRDELPRRVAFDPSANWSPLLATALGVPDVQPVEPGNHLSIGDVANCTAGFREEFYALAEVATEAPQGSDGRAMTPAGWACLVTSGMIDPATIGWGRSERSLGGRRMTHPVADPAAIDAVSARVGRWVRRRMVPKVLVASQTRVLEAALDRRGGTVPVTPVVSVEPLGGVVPSVPVEALAAVLGAPSSSARVALLSAGTGRSTRALRITASTLAGLPVPRDPGILAGLVAAWGDLEAAVAAGRDPSVAGARIDDLLGAGDPSVLEWWSSRIPRGSPST